MIPLHYVRFLQVEWFLKKYEIYIVIFQIFLESWLKLRLYCTDAEQIKFDQQLSV
jgi:hypothetical protein